MAPRDAVTRIGTVRVRNDQDSGTTSVKNGGPGYFHPSVEARTRELRGNFGVESGSQDVRLFHFYIIHALGQNKNRSRDFGGDKSPKS